MIKMQETGETGDREAEAASIDQGNFPEGFCEVKGGYQEGTTASIAGRRNNRFQNNFCAFDSVVQQDDDLFSKMHSQSSKGCMTFVDRTSLLLLKATSFTEGQDACSNDICHSLTSLQGRPSYTAISLCLICDVEQSVCRRYDAQPGRSQPEFP